MNMIDTTGQLINVADQSKYGKGTLSIPFLQNYIYYTLEHNTNDTPDEEVAKQ